VISFYAMERVKVDAVSTLLLAPVSTGAAMGAASRWQGRRGPDRRSEKP
jgi:hypothetical protein